MRTRKYNHHHIRTQKKRKRKNKKKRTLQRGGTTISKRTGVDTGRKETLIQQAQINKVSQKEAALSTRLVEGITTLINYSTHIDHIDPIGYEIKERATTLDEIIRDVPPEENLTRTQIYEESIENIPVDEETPKDTTEVMAARETLEAMGNEPLGATRAQTAEIRAEEARVAEEALVAEEGKALSPTGSPKSSVFTTSPNR